MGALEGLPVRAKLASAGWETATPALLYELDKWRFRSACNGLELSLTYNLQRRY